MFAAGLCCGIYFEARIPADEKYDPADPLGGVFWRDEILQVMYWMTGEGFGSDFGVADPRRFLQAGEALLAVTLEQKAAGGLLERAGEGGYALSEAGRREGGRRFADEFEEMLRPVHFECDEPDCDCHNPESAGEACKHFSPAHPEHLHERQQERIGAVGAPTLRVPEENECGCAERAGGEGPGCLCCTTALMP